MTDVAPETVEALVATVREALEHLCDCGTEVYDGPRREREAMSALVRLRSLLLRAEEERDHYRFHFDQQEARAEALREALQRIADEPPDRGLTPNFREFARAALATPEETKETEGLLAEETKKAEVRLEASA